MKHIIWVKDKLKMGIQISEEVVVIKLLLYLHYRQKISMDEALYVVKWAFSNESFVMLKYCRALTNQMCLSNL